MKACLVNHGADLEIPHIQVQVETTLRNFATMGIYGTVNIECLQLRGHHIYLDESSILFPDFVLFSKAESGSGRGK